MMMCECVLEDRMKQLVNICLFSSVFLFSCSIIAFTVVFMHNCSNAAPPASAISASQYTNNQKNGNRNQRNGQYLRQAPDAFDPSEVVNLDKWEPPLEFQHNYPYYLSGFDHQNRPIWVAELGKWNIRKIFQDGSSGIFERYLDQILFRFNQSIQLKSTEYIPVKGAVAILDLENYDLTQAPSLPTLQLMLKKSRDIRATASRLEKGFFLNTNFVAERLVNVLKPILGAVLSRVEIYGTNKDKWIGELVKQLPKESLPEWYGGHSHFLPLQVYG